MKFIDTIKNKLRKARDVFTGDGVENSTTNTSYQRTTTASRRAARLGNMRYLHVSKPLSADVQYATALGLHGLAAQMLRSERGETYYA